MSPVDHASGSLQLANQANHGVRSDSYRVPNNGMWPASNPGAWGDFTLAALATGVDTDEIAGRFTGNPSRGERNASSL